MKYRNGDLIKLAQDGEFDVIAHGCNCFCTMGNGIAPQMAKAFGADKFKFEGDEYRGDINKLGCIDSVTLGGGLVVINAYTQYHYYHPSVYGVQLDYDALRLCMRKINNMFKHQHIGLPKIGCGLAGGNWEKVESIIKGELADCNVTIVNYSG